MAKKVILGIILCMMIILPFGALNLQPVIGQYFIHIIDSGGATYSPDPGDMTYPEISHYDPDDFEPKPDSRKTVPPGFEMESAYLYDQMYQNSDNVINLQITNLGGNPIFIYGYGLKSENGKTSYYDSGYYIEPGNSQDIGLLPLKVPAKNHFTITPYVYVMARSDSGRWHDYEMQNFEVLEFETAQTPATNQNVYFTNPADLFEKINNLVNATEPAVRTTAVSTVKNYSGAYNVYQLCALFDHVRSNVDYVSDPGDMDYWAKPTETLNNGAGDCEDYAILVASLVESIGGTTRIYLTDDHAFAAAYMGNENESIPAIEAIGEYYNGAPVYYFIDDYGLWVILDASAGMYAGDLPVGAAPTADGWTFLNKTNVTVIDITRD